MATKYTRTPALATALAALPEPTVVAADALPTGKGAALAMAVDATGKPTTDAAKVAGVVHAQRFIVTRGAKAGDWLRMADRPQMPTPTGKVMVWLPATLKANVVALDPIAKAMRCTHSHDAAKTGYDWKATGKASVWGDLKANPATGRTCGYCETGACTGRTALGRAQTYAVAHTSQADTCTAAHADWKGHAKAKREAEAKAKAEAKARAEARKAKAAKSA